MDAWKPAQVLPPIQTREAIIAQARLRKSDTVSAFDCDVIREAFRKSVVEENIPTDRWRSHAAALIRTFTGLEDIDPDMLEWIVPEIEKPRR